MGAVHIHPKEMVDVTKISHRELTVKRVDGGLKD
jgi:hypothetical protein